jgi:Flp pilus assembly protein TadG
MMTTHPKISARRRRRSSGNTMLESVFTLLPLIAVLTFFFDMTFALFSWSTIQNAVREGCRYAITFQTSGGLGQNASIEAVVEQYGMGLITSSNASLMHVNYFSPLAPNTAIGLGASPPANSPGNIVEVSIQGYPLSWLFPLSGSLSNPYRGSSPATISTYSSDILGGYPAGTTSVTE